MIMVDLSPWASRALRREGFHLVQDIGDRTLGELEGRIQEHFADARVLVPANVIANVLQRAAEDAPVLPLRRGRHPERSARGDDDPGGIAPRAPRMLARSGDGSARRARWFRARPA